MRSEKKPCAPLAIECLEQRLTFSASAMEIDPSLLQLAGDEPLVMIGQLPAGRAGGGAANADTGGTDPDPSEIRPPELQMLAPLAEHQVAAVMDQFSSDLDVLGMQGMSELDWLDFPDVSGNIPHDLDGRFETDRPDPLGDFNAIIEGFDRYGMEDIPRGEGTTPVLNPRMTGRLVAGEETGEMGVKRESGVPESSAESEEWVESGSSNNNRSQTTLIETSNGNYIEEVSWENHFDGKGNLIRSEAMWTYTLVGSGNGGLTDVITHREMVHAGSYSPFSGEVVIWDYSDKVPDLKPPGSNQPGDRPGDLHELRMDLSKHEHLIDDSWQDDPRILLLGNPVPNSNAVGSGDDHGGGADRSTGDLVNPVDGDMSGGDGGRYPIDFAPDANSSDAPHRPVISSRIAAMLQVIDPIEE